MSDYHHQLRSHALADLTNRAKSGILTYLGCWMILALTFKLDELHPDFLYLNTGLIILFAVSRVTHLMVLNKSPSPDIDRLHRWLVLTILASALHWGCMSGWIIYDESLSELETAILILTPAFTIGGASTLSISSEIRTLYPVLIFFPMIAALLQAGTSSDLMYALLCTICLAYIYTSTRATNKDYWAAITNHLVAEERAEIMEQLSTTDPLTQLKNRMFFDKEYGNEWKRCSRMSCSLSIIMIDLDHFKKLNDTYGHIFGDECLKETAQAIKQEVARPSDCVARYGGEEFIVLLPNTNRKGAENIAKRMLEAVAALEFKHEEEIVRITCSIGGATTTPDFRSDRSDLIKDADTALYYAKEHGRNQYYANSSRS